MSFNRAATIYQVLTTAAAQIRGDGKNAHTLSRQMEASLHGAGFRVDYALACHPDTLQEYAGPITGPCVLLVAARLGATRLIDNVMV